MQKIIGSILGLVAIINGFGILADSTCDSVSFGGRGGSNLMELYNKELKRKAKEQNSSKKKNIRDVLSERVKKVHVPANV